MLLYPEIGILMVGVWLWTAHQARAAADSPPPAHNRCILSNIGPSGQGDGTSKASDVTGSRSMYVIMNVPKSFG